jgi:hypothetical protein
MSDAVRQMHVRRRDRDLAAVLVDRNDPVERMLVPLLLSDVARGREDLFAVLAEKAARNTASDWRIGTSAIAESRAQVSAIEALSPSTPP